VSRTCADLTVESLESLLLQAQSVGLGAPMATALGAGAAVSASAIATMRANAATT